MKKVLAVLLILAGCFVGIAWAITVTTTDGQNYSVTNDVGVTTNWTNAAIEAKELFYNRQMTSDNQQITRAQQAYQSDSEGEVIAQGMEAMAVNAYNAFQSSIVTVSQATNSTGANWTDNSTLNNSSN